MSLPKTWSNDSLKDLQTQSRPSNDLTRPRKHARRTSLPVSNKQAASTSSLGGGSAASNGAVGPGDVDVSSYQAERRRFRDALGAGVSGKKIGSLSPSRRRGSEPTSSSNGAIKRSLLGQSNRHLEGVDGDDESDGEDENEDELRSPADSSTTNAAGTSERNGRYEEPSSSDASSSERHAFDWDVAKKRTSTQGMPSLPSLNSDLSKRSKPLRRSFVGNGGQKDSSGGAPDTPTMKKRELESEEAVSVSAIKSVQTLAQRSTNGNASPASATQVSPSGFEPSATSTFRKAVKPSVRKIVATSSLETAIIIAGGIFACIYLAEYEDELISRQAYGLASVVLLSALFCLLRSPSEYGAIWATDERNYRPSGDDGAICGLVLGPLLAATSLFTSLAEETTPRMASGDSLVDPPWRIESPRPILGARRLVDSKLSALTLSRSALLSLQCLTSITMLCHLLATKYIRKPSQFSKSNWVKLWSFMKFSTTLSLLLALVREAFVCLNIPVWTDVSRSELITATLCFQCNLYTISRLARKSFTLGELGIVSTVGVTLTLEALNLTTAKLFPASTQYIKTFRRPTPLLVFQLALVVGTFMIGFLLSPLLYLSRHLAQKPVHRLRWPHKRDLHRRLLAGFFFFFSAVYVVGVLGFWVWWLLGRKNPWMWTINFVLEGRRWWSRPLLVGYWLALVSISISGWHATVLAGGRRLRIRPAGASVNGQQIHTVPARMRGIQPGVSVTEASDATAKLRGGSAGGNVLGSGESSNGTLSFPKKAAYLSLNARRKFFHALAVLLFTPGIAFDPAFSHLAFSLAFSAFIFAEYIRYYALYPFGAALHVFMSEFTDHKDCGPVILSHFYLLTGCASPLWIEGVSNLRSRGVDAASLGQTSHRWFSWWTQQSLPTQHTSAHGQVDISMFIGVLTLGVGDALASVIGRRYGRVCWPRSTKTLEGSLAFMGSIFGSALLLRAIGWCAPFSLGRFAVVTVFLGILEGSSNQNDNLVLPIFAFIALSLFQV